MTACGQEEAPTPTVTNTAEAIVVAATAATLPPTTTNTPVPTATLLPTAVPSPTPIVPAFSIADQTLTDNGELTIDQVVSPVAGWVVVVSSTGETLATVAVDAGIFSNLTLTLNPFQATPDLTLTLYADDGTSAPNFDQPLAEASTTIALDIALPSLLVSDQVVWEDGLLLIDTVQVFEPSWLVVSNVADPEQVLGVSPITAGVHENVVVEVPQLQINPQVQVMLAVDRGNAGIYEPTTTDTPTLVAGNPIVAQLQLTLPPDIFVLDQPVIDNKIILERVISDGNGWVTIYLDNFGTVGNAIGAGYLEDGVNERVVVELRSIPSPILYARLHEDTGILGTFDFPGDDEAIIFTDRFGTRRFTQTPIHITTGVSYIIANQTVINTVTIDTLITNTPLWAVVRADNNGEMGAVLGRVKLPAGYHWNATIPVDNEQVTDTLYIALYNDRGEEDIFEFPDGEDTIFIQSGQPVFMSFTNK